MEPVLSAKPLFIRDADPLMKKFRGPDTGVDSPLLVGLQAGEQEHVMAMLDPVLSESARHLRNCTYGDDRNAHCDKCVDDDSEIYARPELDRGNRGGLIDELPIRYARLYQSAPGVAAVSGQASPAPCRINIPPWDRMRPAVRRRGS
jgi:hypothetical protein